MPAAVAAAGAIIHYLKHQLRRKIDHLTSLRCDASAEFVILDAATQTNLELVDSRSTRDASLFGVLDRTATGMGGRRLRSWILQPLREIRELECRQQMIADLLREPDLLGSIRAELKTIHDLERAAGRLSQASGNARDLVALKTSLEQIPLLKRELAKLIERNEFGTGRDTSSAKANESKNGPYQSLAARLQQEIEAMPALAEKLTRAVMDDPPLALKEGGIFRDGFDPDLDELRASIAGRQELDRRVTGTGNRRHRHQIVEGAVQLGLRLLHRNNEKQSRQRTRPHTSANKRPSAVNDSSRLS